MYFQHWKLKRPPFDPQPDSTFLFPTPENQLALATMTYAACEGGEPLVLDGPPGCGKTLLLRALRRQLPRERYKPVYLSEVGCGQMGLLRRLAWKLSHAAIPDTDSAMERIVRSVEEYERREHTLLLLIDDWPVTLAPRMLEELRWLCNLDIERSRLCVFLAGEGLDPAALWPEWLAQRVCARLKTAPLDADSTPAYLAHRMRVAGCADERVFTADAAACIHEWSKGVPRLINRAAHLALHIGYEDMAPRIDLEAAQGALERLSPPPHLAARAA